MSEGVQKSYSESFFGEMGEEANRLSTFKNWPFNDSSNRCTASKMAEAGFFHCPTKNHPDLVQCFVCFKELDGWESQDDPWEEHASHTKDCLFVQLNKKEQDLTIEELYLLEAQRHINKAKQITAQQIQKFREEAEKLRTSVEELM